MSLNFNNVIIGGTSGGGGQTINNQDITVTQNGEYTAESGYTGLGTVTVSTPVINNQDMTITENGEYTAESGYSGLGTVTVDVPTGGSIGNGQYMVKVIDYDGKILKLDYLNSGETFTLPDIPAHDGLIFQEWSSTKPIVNNTVTVTDNHILIGAVYDTASGMSEFDIQINGGQSISLRMTGTIDWGDGTIDTNVDIYGKSHTYSTTGYYTIKCNGSIGTITSGSNIVDTTNAPKADFIKAVRFSSNITTIPFNTFYKCSSIAYVSIPKGVTTIGGTGGQATGTFGGANHLTHLILPSTVTTLQGGYFASECKALKTFVSSAITSVEGSDIKSCYSLNELVLPNTVTSFGYGACQSCSGVTGTVVMPSGLTSIGQYAFAYNNSIDVYDFSNCTSVPTLANTNAFTLQQSDKIYVPANLIDQWKAASNWSSIKGYITVKS